MERGLPTQSQPLMLMPRLSLGIMVGTAMDGLTTVATITERGLLMLSQPQMLMLKPIHGMATMDGPTTVATGTERGLPTLSQFPMPMLRLSRGIMAATDGLTMVATGMERDLLMLSQPQMLTLKQPWYYGGYGWPHYGGYWYGKRSADAEPAP